RVRMSFQAAQPSTRRPATLAKLERWRDRRVASFASAIAAIFRSTSSRCIVFSGGGLRSAILHAQARRLIVGGIVLERSEPPFPPGHGWFGGLLAFLLQARDLSFQYRHPLFQRHSCHQKSLPDHARTCSASHAY